MTGTLFSLAWGLCACITIMGAFKLDIDEDIPMVKLTWLEAIGLGTAVFIFWWFMAYFIIVAEYDRLGHGP